MERVILSWKIVSQVTLGGSEECLDCSLLLVLWETWRASNWGLGELTIPFLGHGVGESGLEMNSCVSGNIGRS